MAVRATFEGRVQGVWFRAWTTEQAVARGLNGWVRNRADGTVEALFAGPADVVEDMIAACRQGPPAAQVTSVTTEPAEDPGETGFRQLPTV
ncbi:MAG: acylphosphatase [Rhodospirillales bacterium]|jgi:acylphosphatase|nr:acylphosphatase [Rhodospirillales bacterium]HJO97882.1 acylphosphatase [Rhodospirillales bacterium]